MSDLRTLYARFVLWLIRPALELREASKESEVHGQRVGVEIIDP